MREKVINAILENPEQFDMADWMYEAQCGTTMCLAGWALYLDGQGSNLKRWLVELDYDAIEDEASRLLDVHFDAFYSDSWPTFIRDVYYNALDGMGDMRTVIEQVYKEYENHS